MAGVPGYELDLTRLTEAECREIAEQVRRCRETEALVREGVHYRLSGMREMARYAAWEYVSRDGTRAVLNLVVTDPAANGMPVHVKPKGLIPGARYRVGEEFTCTGQALMSGGYTFERLTGDYPCAVVTVTATDDAPSDE